MQILGAFIGSALMAAWRHAKVAHVAARRPRPGSTHYSLAQLQELRDQFRDDIDERARRACLMLVADGGIYVRVERDGTAHHYSRGRLLRTARASRSC